mgnify:CR=1 FL=1
MMECPIANATVHVSVYRGLSNLMATTLNRSAREPESNSHVVTIYLVPILQLYWSTRWSTIYGCGDYLILWSRH